LIGSKTAGRGSAVFVFRMLLCACELAAAVDVDAANRDKMTRHTLATRNVYDIRSASLAS
jgi:hypothetical protein